jgi:hypothetical protein
MLLDVIENRHALGPPQPQPAHKEALTAFRDGHNPHIDSGTAKIVALLTSRGRRYWWLGNKENTMRLYRF